MRWLKRVLWFPTVAQVPKLVMGLHSSSTRAAQRWTVSLPRTEPLFCMAWTSYWQQPLCFGYYKIKWPTQDKNLFKSMWMETLSDYVSAGKWRGEIGLYLILKLRSMKETHYVWKVRAAKFVIPFLTDTPSFRLL